MKISYQHSVTQNRTSITLSDRVLRLWAIVHSFDSTSDDFLYDEKTLAYLKGYITDCHRDYLKGCNNFSTFVSYFENAVFIDVERKLLDPSYIAY